jgi:6,7-dimethyl-8-ribityllumazine synthase
VLTTENLAQAQQRAASAKGDKGHEAALAAARLLQVPRALPRAGFRT